MVSAELKSIPTFVATIMTPSIIFMLISTPVKKRNILQEILMILLWIIGLRIPFYYAGQYSYMCCMCTAVWAWATSMKMGVWIFMSMEERRKQHFVYTLIDWRKYLQQNSTKAVLAEYEHINIVPYLITLLQNLIKFDFMEFLFSLSDPQRPIRVLTFLIVRSLDLIGYSQHSIVIPDGEPITSTYVLVSVMSSILFCIYIQIQLQVTYDVFMVIFAGIYQFLPALERWQLGKDSSKLKTKNIGKAKIILKRIQYIRSIKGYIENMLRMPNLFDTPWSALSLRDFWGKRWHTIYNECFYLLGYRPIRTMMMNFCGCKPPRWLPALSVFVMSGLMHEYFLYSSTGHQAYFYGEPLAVCGLQFVFFIFQAFAIGIGDTTFKNGWAGRIYALLCMAISCHLFVVPYILTGYLYMERFSFYRMVLNLSQGNYNTPFAFVQL